MLKSDAVKKDKLRRLSRPKCEYGNTWNTGNLLYLKLFSKPTAVRQRYDSGTIAVVLADNGDVISIFIEVEKRKKPSVMSAGL